MRGLGAGTGKGELVQNPLSNPLVLAFLSMVVNAAALFWAIGRGQGAAHSRWWLVLAALPGLLVLAVFYSLAFRMHSHLGGWPDSYGTHWLPGELLPHVHFANWMFTVGVLTALFMPAVLAVFALAPRLRAGMIYPASCGLACWASLWLTLLAPSGFQDWWWD